MFRDKIIVPKSLQPRMRVYSRILTEPIKSEDTFLILKEKNQEKSEITLSENLAEIFLYSLQSIYLAEAFCAKKHPKLIKSLVPHQEIIGYIYFSDKIKILNNGHLLTHLAECPIQNFYALLFGSLKEIFEQYEVILEESPNLYKPPRNNYREITEEKIYQTIIDEDSLKNDYFRNNFLTKILLLQIPADNLRKMCDMTPSPHSDLITRQIRASAGGRVANFGEQLLLEKTIEYLQKNRPSKEKFKSKSAFNKMHYDNFASILEDYQKITQENSTIKFGRNLLASNFLRKILFWSKNSEQFIAELSFHIYSDKEKEKIKNDKLKSELNKKSKRHNSK